MSCSRTHEFRECKHVTFHRAIPMLPNVITHHSKHKSVLSEAFITAAPLPTCVYVCEKSPRTHPSRIRECCGIEPCLAVLKLPARGSQHLRSGPVIYGDLEHCRASPRSLTHRGYIGCADPVKTLSVPNCAISL